jgi:hypothetical protein
MLLDDKNRPLVGLAALRRGLGRFAEIPFDRQERSRGM